ncbi:ArnT family glycosyltransferase [Haladaptatus sp. CMAA 1911]|uniref:ArnT family glycosyltransferase n=1 Tax=unclassified Haladaptatus TaxID=2622732 RepID=UPI003754DA9D
MAEQIAKHGYQFPRIVPQYTANGVPFAYPPLMFYCLAVLHGIFHVDLFTLTRYLPGVITIASLFPFYLFSKELLQSPQRAGIASFILATTPVFIRWHFSAGGVVRAPAFLFSLAGLYTALRLCKTTSWRWISPTVVWFTLTALTHPEYTLFLSVSIIVFTSVYARTIRGFTYSLLVAICGFFLTIPWWGRIISIYSIDNIVSASSTHGGLGGGITVLTDFVLTSSHSSAAVTTQPHSYGIILTTLWYAIPIIGIVYLISSRRLFLPGWLLFVGIITGELRFIFTVGSLVTAVFVLDGAIPWITRQLQPSLSRQHALTAVLLILAILGGNIMTLYASGAVTEYGGSNSMPSFVDEQDYAAMQWTQRNIDQSSEFIVIGDAAEWFPYLANRTNVVGPWGVEWERSPVAYQWQYTAYQRLSTTTSVTDLNQKIALTSTTPDYIYVPRGTYTVYGRKYHQQRSFMTELYRSDEYRRVYRNRGVVIFERTTNSST